MLGKASEVVFDFTTEDGGYGMTLRDNDNGAQEYNDDPTVLTNDGVTITINGKSRWWKATAGIALRFYKDSKFTVAAPEGENISKIVITGSKPAQFAATGYANGTWTGSASEVTFACTISSSNITIQTITITLGEGEGGGDDPVVPDDPEPTVGYGVYTKADAMSDGDFVLFFPTAGKIATPIASDKKYGYMPAEEATPKGDEITTLKSNAFKFTAVDGGYTITDTYNRYLIMTGDYNSFNLSADRTDGDLWSVNITPDSVVIKNVSTSKTLQYDSQYSSIGIYPDVRGEYPALYKFTKDTDVQPEEPALDVFTGLNQVAKAADGKQFIMGCDLTTVFSQGAYNYVFDGSTYGLVYKYDLGLQAGDVIAKGWEAKVSIYNNLVEIVPAVDSLQVSATGAALPEPMDIEGDEASMFLTASNQSAYVRLLDVTFAEATPAADAPSAERTYTGTFGDETVTFYQRFGLPSVAAGTYDVVGFVAVYKETVQIYPIRIGDTTGISSAAVEAQPARYFNLQGVEVSNPQSGNIYIRLEGNKASKVIK